MVFGDVGSVGGVSRACPEGVSGVPGELILRDPVKIEGLYIIKHALDPPETAEAVIFAFANLVEEGSDMPKTKSALAMRTFIVTFLADRKL